MDDLVVGVDLGTSGVRACACDQRGAVVARATHPFRGGADADQPEHWWRAAAQCLRALTADLGARRTAIGAVSVAAISGSVCLLDARGAPIAPALLYHDRRGTAEAALLNNVAAAQCAALGYQFNSSWGLPKLVWLARHAPELLGAADRIAHAGDVLTGQLCGNHALTDATQALKSGYDLLGNCWPAWIDTLGVPRAKLPQVVPSGSVLGTVSARTAEQTGLPARALVVAGMTDGCAAQVAAGAVEPGQWLSVLGTTLVLKGVSGTLLRDPLGRFYSHRHPSGGWLPSAASHTGGAALSGWSAPERHTLDLAAATLTPTDLICYPLQQTGERFPFVQPAAEGFWSRAPMDERERYAATLEGVAYLERLGYAAVAALGAPVSGPLRTTGGGAQSAVWTQIRADVLQRPIAVASAPDAAVGAAIVAAAGLRRADLRAVTATMARIAHTVEPRPQLAAAYDARYARFVAACQARGYLEATP